MRRATPLIVNVADELRGSPLSRGRTASPGAGHRGRSWRWRRLAVLALCLSGARVAQAELGDMAGARRLLAYAAAAPLDLQVVSSSEHDGITIQDLTFASPKGGRVPAYLVAPVGGGLHPGVVFGHWGFGNRTEFLAEAELLAEAGAVSILIDYPWERPAPWRREAPIIAEPEKSFQAYVQAIVDLRRAFDVLLARPDVEARKIAYVGHSYGAQWGAVLAAVDRRMKTAVLMAGVPDAATLYLDAQEPGLVEWRKTFPPGQMEKFVEVFSRLDAIRFVPEANPIPLLFQFARRERIMSEADMTRYFDAAKGPKSILWYDTGHELLDPRAQADRAAWLQAHLGLKHLTRLLQKRMRQTTP
jgi:dienelactone hydrolase